MKKGTFVSYQLAEAILMLYKCLDNNKSLYVIQAELDKLKEKWKQDILPATGKPIPDLAGMQELTVEQLLKISKEVTEYDTYTVENAAGMQNATRVNEDGTVDFNFSALDKIAELARINGKKIVIDSAIVHGDHFPEHFSKLSKEQLRECIKSYITELVSKYGDVIERIDVLNAIFERKDIKSKDGVPVEDFWISKFGENYGEEIINICKEALGDKEIPLCWNEFYITNINCRDRKIRFLDTVRKIENLDVIGVQDTFQDTADIAYTTNVLRQIEDICMATGKKYAITELSCILSHQTVDELYSKIVKDSSGSEMISEEDVNNIEERINNIIEGVVKYSSDSECCVSIEGRISKELDYYSHRPELRDFNERTHTLINTVGNKLKNIVKEQETGIQR